MENKYTARDFFKAILANENLGATERAYAETALVKLDERNEKRKTAPKKVDPEKQALREAILAYVAEHPRCNRDEIASAIGYAPATVSSNCTVLKGEGKLTSEYVKLSVQRNGKSVRVEKTVYTIV